MRRRKRSRESTGNRQNAQVWGAAGRCLLLPVALGHVRHWTLSGHSVLWRARTHSADARQSALAAPLCTGCSQTARTSILRPHYRIYFPHWGIVARHHRIAAWLWTRPSRTGSCPRPPLLAKFLGLSPYFAMSLSQSEPWHLGTRTARKQTHTPLQLGG